MNKLLSANFFRLRKNKCFRGSLAFMFVIGIASPLLRYRDMKQSGYINNLDNGFFMCALFIGIILAVFCSLFIGTEHNDGTIRNKIIVGQKRETIYLSNMVTCSIIAITMCIVFFVPYLSVGIPLLGFFVADMKMIVMIGITVLVLSVTFADLGTVMPNVYHTKEEMIECVNAFYEGMVRRSEEMKQHPNYKTGENYAYLGLPPCFLIFDEYVAFFEMLGTKESVSLLSQLKKIVMLGRQAGYFLIVACQRPDAKYFSDGIRDNFNFRVGLGRISELGYGMLFGSDVKKQFFQKRIKGRGYCDVGTSVISEFYTPLVPKGHDFLQTIGRLAQERQAMPEQQGKEDVIE